MHREYVGPVVAEWLSKHTTPILGTSLRRLPCGSIVLIGTEHVYAYDQDRRPAKAKPGKPTRVGSGDCGTVTLWV